MATIEERYKALGEQVAKQAKIKEHRDAIAKAKAELAKLSNRATKGGKKK